MNSRPTFAWLYLALGALLAVSPARAADSYKVGTKQIEFADSHYGDRKLAVVMFYPARVDDPSTRYTLPFFTNLELYKDTPTRPRRRQAPAGDAVAWARLEPVAIWLVR